MPGVISMQAYFFSNPGLQVGIHPAAVGTAPRAFAPGRISVGCPHCLRRFYHARTVTGQESHCPHCFITRIQGATPAPEAMALAPRYRRGSWRIVFCEYAQRITNGIVLVGRIIQFSRFRLGILLRISLAECIVTGAHDL